MSRIYASRESAGKALAERLSDYAGVPSVVLALPRGGVPVAVPIAQFLAAPLDVLVVRKLGVPGREELAFGAIAGGDPPVEVLNQDIIDALGLLPRHMNAVRAAERERLEKREAHYRGRSPAPAVEDRVAIVVDDGLATGASMQVAVETVRRRSPRAIVVAVPVAPPDAVHRLQGLADRVVVDSTPADFRGVGAWYADFSQLSDDDVRRLVEGYGRESG